MRCMHGAERQKSGPRNYRATSHQEGRWGKHGNIGSVHPRSCRTHVTVQLKEPGLEDSSDYECQHGTLTAQYCEESSGAGW